MTLHPVASNRTRRWLTLLGLSLLGGVAISGASAAEALLPPQQVIQDASEKLKERLRREGVKNDFPRANRIVKEIIEPHVDFDRVSALVLGQYWRTASPELRSRFKEEFRILLIRTYATAQVEFVDWDIRFQPLRLAPGDTKAMVRTSILRPGGQPTAVDYRMIHTRSGDWKIYDVIIEGVSLVNNYRSTFASDIERTGSLEHVIQMMSERNTQALKEPLKSGRRG